MSYTKGSRIEALINSLNYLLEISLKVKSKDIIKGIDAGIMSLPVYVILP